MRLYTNIEQFCCNLSLTVLSALKKQHFLRDSTLLLIGQMLANATQFIFSFMTARSLAKGDFGALNTLLAMVQAIGLPLYAVQFSLTREVSVLLAGNMLGKIKYLLHRGMRHMLVYGGAGILVLIVVSPWLKGYFHLETMSPLVLTAVLVFSYILLAVPLGIVHGMQRFVLLSFLIAAGPSTRLLLAVPVRHSLTGVIVAGIVSAIICLAVAFYYIPKTENWSQPADRDISRQEMYHAFWPILIALGCYGLLTNMDMWMVKHFCAPAEADQYSALVNLGRGFIFLPLAIVLALFPKVAEQSARKEDSLPLLYKGISVTLVLILLASIPCVLFPRFLILTLFGPKYELAAQLCPYIGLVMAPFALINLIINYLLASFRTQFLYLLAIGTLLHFVWFQLFHSSLSMMLLVMGLSGCGILIVLMLFTLYAPRLRT